MRFTFPESIELSLSNIDPIVGIVAVAVEYPAKVLSQ